MVIMPYSKFRSCWNLLKSILFLYILLIIPFRFFFNKIDQMGFIIVDIIIDFFFFVDVVL